MSHPVASAPSPAPAKSYAGLIWALVCGAALLIATVAAIGVYRIAATAAEPSRPVTAYLTALEHGDASTALKVDGTKVMKSDVLLTDKVYRSAHDLISRVTVGATRVDGDTATVTAEYSQVGTTRTMTFTLRAADGDLFGLRHWKLQPVPLATTSVTVNGPNDLALSVDGVALPHPEGTVTLRALPGRYQIAAKGTALYTASVPDIAVEGFGGTAAAKPVDADVELTDEGRAAATKAVNDWVDRCIASKALKPAGCSFSVYSNDLGGVTLSNQKWTLASRPTFTVDAWDGDGWTVTQVRAGAASFSAKASKAGATGTFSSVGTVPVQVGGHVSVDDGGIRFTSKKWLSVSDLDSLGGDDA